MPTIPDAARYRLADARVPDCLIDLPPEGLRRDRDGLLRLDIEIANGRIASFAPAGAGAVQPMVALGGAQVWPCFLDMHTHLDKGHIWPRSENPDGTFEGALEAVAADRARHWRLEDLRPRMEFGLKAAFAHGSAAIRTHLDSIAPHHLVVWQAFAELREAWRGRIALQAASILKIADLAGPFGEELAGQIRAAGGILGAVAYFSPTIEPDLERAFALAEKYSLDLDFHVDESLDPGARSLALIARTALRRGFAGQIVCGHCCSLAAQEDSEVERTLDLVSKAGIAVVSLPMCNMYLQDRASGRTPRRRGVTLLHEMRARGIRLALASDNCRDPFYAYGDHDMLEVFSQAARIAHLDRPVGAWPETVARAPAEIMRIPAGRIRVGEPADLVLFRARSYSELLSRPQSDRVVLRQGRAIDTAPPDYRELDALFPEHAA
jgi:cytosine/creatinine deaminase